MIPKYNLRILVPMEGFGLLGCYIANLHLIQV